MPAGFVNYNDDANGDNNANGYRNGNGNCYCDFYSNGYRGEYINADDYANVYNNTDADVCTRLDAIGRVLRRVLLSGYQRPLV